MVHPIGLLDGRLSSNYLVLCIFLFLYWSLIIALALPALFVGLWSFIQELADSSKHASKYQDKDNEINRYHIGHAAGSENNYRTLIRQIIAEETTTEFEGLENKMDKLMEQVKKIDDTDYDSDVDNDDWSKRGSKRNKGKRGRSREKIIFQMVNMRIWYQ